MSRPLLPVLLVLCACSAREAAQAEPVKAPTSGAAQMATIDVLGFALGAPLAKVQAAHRLSGPGGEGTVAGVAATIELGARADGAVNDVSAQLTPTGDAGLAKSPIFARLKAQLGPPQTQMADLAQWRRADLHVDLQRTEEWAKGDDEATVVYVFRARLPGGETATPRPGVAASKAAEAAAAKDK